jgi:hypothetical protein
MYKPHPDRATLLEIVHDYLSDDCIVGNLQHIQQLCDYHSVPATTIRARHNILVRIACSHGHLHVIKWLVEAFKLHAGDIRDNDCSALVSACTHGHLSVVKYLHQQCRFTAEEIRYKGVLRSAYVFLRINVAQWLCKMFELTAADADATDHTVEWICATPYDAERDHTLQWLHVSFGALLPKHMRWTRKTHNEWYWQPHTIAMAHLPSVMLVDVLQCLA